MFCGNFIWRNHIRQKIFFNRFLPLPHRVPRSPPFAREGEFPFPPERGPAEPPGGMGPSTRCSVATKSIGALRHHYPAACYVAPLCQRRRIPLSTAKGGTTESGGVWEKRHPAETRGLVTFIMTKHYLYSSIICDNCADKTKSFNFNFSILSIPYITVAWSRLPTYCPISASDNPVAFLRTTIII